MPEVLLAELLAGVTDVETDVETDGEDGTTWDDEETGVDAPYAGNADEADESAVAVEPEEPEPEPETGESEDTTT